MDCDSSGEDLVVKTRKPYTITKQRERWTDEEHNKFLEAIKLYGRAWQRIEEHIGTKTAVQIRSHAQKFFTKLEKEAIDKGVPIGHALDIEIPPPRPKKKPSNPYPRKTNVGASNSQVGVKDGKTPNPVFFSCQSTMRVPLEKETEGRCEIGKSERNALLDGRGNCTETLTLKLPSSIPLSDVASNEDETSVSQISIEAKGLQTENNKQLLQGNNNTLINDLNQSTDDNRSLPNYPRHAPVHVLDGRLDISADMCEDHGHQNQFMNPTASGTTSEPQYTSRSSIHQSIPSYHPIFTPIQNQDDYMSFLHVSSTFSSLIVSALSQNPAAYAAASLATNLWPSASSEGTFQSQSIHSAPSIAAIAAATVAAATAWWAAHGLLPLCAPFHPGFTHPPASVSETPIDRTVANDERREKSPDPDITGRQLEPECSEALSLSDSDTNDGAKMKVKPVPVETEKDAEMQDENTPKTKKQVDRSSCGSNTSSSDVEAELPIKENDEKQVNSKDEDEELDATHSIGDTFRQRSRSTTNGRLAFQALFSREVLPQSFWSPQHTNNKGTKHCTNENESGEEVVLEINGKTTPDINVNNGLSSSSSPFIGYAKLKGCRTMTTTATTGFKPYKRCSVEAKESSRVVSQDNSGKSPKRLRLHE